MPSSGPTNTPVAVSVVEPGCWANTGIAATAAGIAATAAMRTAASRAEKTYLDVLLLVCRGTPLQTKTHADEFLLNPVDRRGRWGSQLNRTAAIPYDPPQQDRKAEKGAVLSTEAHERQGEEVLDTLAEGPEGFYG